MNRNMNHQTKLTKAQTEVVKAIISGANTQGTIAIKLEKSQQSISKHLKAIMENTNYIISTNIQYGEISYQSTVSALEVVDKEEFVSLPEDYQDPDFDK
jgi:DNA-binding CsgD family transcriptional regulator